MSRVPAEVIGITVVPPYQGFLLILREIRGIRWLPIFIGQPEAQSISILLKKVKTARPLTFDLVGSLVSASRLAVESITVTELRDETFFAEISIVTDRGEHERIDARPSDAVALALKAQAKIYIEEHVLIEAGKNEEIALSDDDPHDEIKRLNRDLQHAVDKEAYEDAARIRDQIRDLERETGGTRAKV